MSHCSKEKSHWVLYCRFIDFAFLPSICFLLVAASDYLLKKEKCRDFQIAKGPSRGWWTFPFPSPKKSLFCFVCTYWVSLFICLCFFVCVCVCCCFLPYVYPTWHLPFTRFSMRCVYKVARRGKEEKDYLKASVYQNFCENDNSLMVAVRGTVLVLLWTWQPRCLHSCLPDIFFRASFIPTSYNTCIDAISKIQAMGNFASL